MLNYIWAFMLLISVVYGACTGRLADVSGAILEGSASAISLAISMAGVVSLWCGIVEIAQQAGIVRAMSRIMRPVIGWLFPGLAGSEGEKAREYITLNFILNILGTGASATGPGLMAMEEFKRLSDRNMNVEKAEPEGADDMGAGTVAATDEMCTFLVLNISSLQLIPVNIIAYRSAYGSAEPEAIIIPALLATGISTASAIIFCRLMRRMAKIRDRGK